MLVKSFAVALRRLHVFFPASGVERHHGSVGTISFFLGYLRPLVSSPRTLSLSCRSGMSSSPLCISHLFEILVLVVVGDGLQPSRYLAGLKIPFVVAMAVHSVHLNGE